MKRILAKSVAIVVLGATALLPTAASAQAATTSYGAIAVSGNGARGSAWNYPSRADAERAALGQCGHSDCKVLVWFSRCGAVSYSPGARMWTGGYGENRSLAEAASRQYTDSYVQESICTAS